MGQLFRDTGIQRYSDTSIKHTPFFLKSTTKHNTHIIIPRHGTTKHILTHIIFFKRHNAGSMPVVTRGPPTDVGQALTPWHRALVQRVAEHEAQHIEIISGWLM